MSLEVKGSIEKRKNLEDKLYTIVYKYQIKYIYYLFEKQYDDNKQSRQFKNLYSKFQKRLLRIAEWSNSDEILDKEYNKFLQWCKKKYDLSENELQQILTTIIKLFVKIMINKSNIIVDGILEQHTFPKFKHFFYKCLKNISRKYYENPKMITMVKNEIDDKMSKYDLLKIIKNVVYKYLPIQEMISLFEYKELIEEPDNVEQNIIEYDFNISSDSISSESNKPQQLVIEKQLSECSLKYVSSNDFEKEYCKSESESKQSIKKSHGSQNDDDENNLVKYVNVPKNKPLRPFYYKKKKINELNESFFDE